MDYKELLEDRDFYDPEEVCKWMDEAQKAIGELIKRAQMAETAIAEIQSARDHTRPACVVDDILRAYYKEREE